MWDERRIALDHTFFYMYTIAISKTIYVIGKLVGQCSQDKRVM